MSSTFPRAPWSTPLITLPMGCLEVWEILLGNSSRQGQVEQFFQLLDCLGEGRKEAKSSSSVWVYGHINYVMTHINTCMFVTALSTKPCAGTLGPTALNAVPIWGVLGCDERKTTCGTAFWKQQQKAPFICSCLTSDVVKSLFQCFKWKMFVPSSLPQCMCKDAMLRMESARNWAHPHSCGHWCHHQHLLLAASDSAEDSTEELWNWRFSSNHSSYVMSWQGSCGGQMNKEIRLKDKWCLPLLGSSSEMAHSSISQLRPLSLPSSLAQLCNQAFAVTLLKPWAPKTLYPAASWLVPTKQSRRRWKLTQQVTHILSSPDP